MTLAPTMTLQRLQGSLIRRCGLFAALSLGCDGTTFVDCPTFDRASCLDTDACRYRLFGDGSGECRNTCDGLSKDDPCPDGFTCEYVTYYDPAHDDQMPGPQTDLCVDD